ncbi:hypothetical protein PLICRDRAFT_678606 [Plicaturopsis crispa FD-325 SS-3]|nr:hypothetical protein PLICRDRAFT_678606 [Plicaturopsis crispa FD-325 SS-3]
MSNSGGLPVAGPPIEEIEPHLRRCWVWGRSDKEIAEELRDHFDTEKYGISATSVKRIRGKLGLLGTAKQNHTRESISEYVATIRARFPTMGARQMVVTLRQDYGMKVPEKLLLDYFKETEPAAVQRRKAKRFKRKRFWAAGVMDMLTFDQHDKWQRFGLFLHMAIEPFSGRIAWLKIWRSNSNPRLITKYYLDSSREVGGIPLVSQSDPGSENNGIANCHTLIRHRLDPSLEGTLQHRWMRNKTNIKPEAGWSQMRRQFTPGFETILDEGLHVGWYDPANPLEKLVFLWLAVPWLQQELDAWVARYNNSSRRADKNKILPVGIPNHIFSKPEKYGAKDFMIRVTDSSLFDEMEQQWAPPEHPIFQLVPPTFAAQANELYRQLGNPLVSGDTFWAVYRSLLQAFRPFSNTPLLADVLGDPSALPEGELEMIQILPNLRELRNGDAVVGTGGEFLETDSADGQAAGSSTANRIYVQYFSDDEDEAGSE